MCRRRQGDVPPDIISSQGCVEFPQRAFAVVPAPALLHSHKDVFTAQRVRQTDYSIVPVTSENGLVVPVDARNVDAFRPSWGTGRGRQTRQAAQHLDDLKCSEEDESKAKHLLDGAAT